MKRFHVHVAVDDLERSIRFYTALFGAAPSVTRPDYAKWMLDDPRVNFAISHRHETAGVNHLGIQVETAEELQQLRGQLEAADATLLEQSGASCCYAKSDKYWVTDPAHVAWETFRALGEIPVYGEDVRTRSDQGACCIPLARPNAGEPKSGDTTRDDRACCV